MLEQKGILKLSPSDGSEGFNMSNLYDNIDGCLIDTDLHKMVSGGRGPSIKQGSNSNLKPLLLKD